jgi:hypothetical protein
MGLKEWLASQPFGTMSRMLIDLHTAGTPVSWATICRASRGQPIGDRTARAISKYTRGQVPVELLRAGLRVKAARERRGRTRKRRKAA